MEGHHPHGPVLGWRRRSHDLHPSELGTFIQATFNGTLLTQDSIAEMKKNRRYRAA